MFIWCIDNHSILSSITSISHSNPMSIPKHDHTDRQTSAHTFTKCHSGLWLCSHNAHHLGTSDGQTNAYTYSQSVTQGCGCVHIMVINLGTSHTPIQMGGHPWHLDIWTSLTECIYIHYVSTRREFHVCSDGIRRSTYSYMCCCCCLASS